ncbi:Rpa49 subunit specific to nuclear RNA polymerase I [Multifurca ochricompacta]|uniref:Rpa49 subunit specific to nuclear RNA polymerase I n=1 Tax=Multifurca ochricompacta TaxID=376703 RepID=A0AAD4LYW5_9AGAM|nr:Rpa49 subunit specific to nuclear RNA polymerase I [Multifurca ochricompacta]
MVGAPQPGRSGKLSRDLLLEGACLRRKRSPSDADESTTLSIEPTSLSNAQIGPVLASFPCVIPPRDTAFDTYVREEDEGKEFVKRLSTIAGETETVEFFGSANEDLGSRYFLALHRPGSSKLILQPTPVYLMSRQVKAFKAFKPTGPGTLEHAQARNKLGEAFGTKKAKAAIRAHERNKVDVHAMEDVAGVLQDRIDEGTENLPTQEKMEDMANAARLIPPYNADAKRPQDIYPLHNIIPEPEWAALDGLLHKLKNATDDRSRIRLLPNARSDWLRQHLMLVYSAPKPNSKLTHSREECSREGRTIERLAPAPEAIIDSLLGRFTDTPRGSEKAQITSENETSLLTHLFSLCLRVDDYATDTALIASDLRISPARVNSLFRSLGCTIGKLSSQDLNRLGLPESVALQKRAILKAPLTFPKSRLRRRA